MGVWCNLISINGNDIKINFHSRELTNKDNTFSLNNLPLIGEHNFKNYISAILAAEANGICNRRLIRIIRNF